MERDDLEFPRQNMTLFFMTAPCYSDVWLGLTDWSQGTNIVRFRGEGGGGAGPRRNFEALRGLSRAFQQDQRPGGACAVRARTPRRYPDMEFPCDDTAGNALHLHWVTGAHVQLMFSSAANVMGHGCGKNLSIEVTREKHPATLTVLRSFAHNAFT